MILTVAASLTLLGFTTWVTGALFGFHELGVIGGVLIFGVGAMVGATGLEHESGEIVTEADNETVVETTYETFDAPVSVPIGFIVMLTGAGVLLRSIERLGGNA